MKALGLGTKSIMASLCFASAVQAMPSAYVSKYGSLFIENMTNSTLLRDTEKSQTVWVLPPSAGKTSFSGLVPSANLGFCSGIQELMIASNRVEQRVAQLIEQQSELEPELKTAEQALLEAQKALGEVVQSDAMKEVLLVEDAVAELNSQRDALLEQIESCTESCEETREAFRQVSEDIRTAKADLRELKQQHREDVREYNRAKLRVEMAEEAFNTVGKRFDRIRSKLVDISADIFQLYANKGRLEGGYAKIDYDSGWEQNIQKLESSYSSYDFKAIPTSNARINANIVGSADQQSYYESLPMILDYSIDGTKYVPWGDVDHTGSALPTRMAGNIRLSTLGACPLADKTFFEPTGFKPEVGTSGDPLFAISATYQYPAAFKFKVTASYNLYKFYELIKEQGQRGGFFTSSSYSKVMETKLDEDDFKIDWVVEDPDSKYDEETREKIKNEIKKDLMDRVLQTMAQPIVSGVQTATFADPGMPPENGAVVLANGLSKTCGFNIYCQAGSWVLRGLNAIFGSSRVEQTFRSKWNRTSTETWSAEAAKYRPGIISYTR